MEGGVKIRNGWTIFDPFNRHKADPLQETAPDLDDVPEIPLAKASFLSTLTFSWISPILVRGYRKPLELQDLWKLDESRQSGHLADVFLENLDARFKNVEEHNAKHPDKLRKPGILLALYDTFKKEIWMATAFKFFGDLAQATSPLLLRKIIMTVSKTDSSVREGVGYAVGLFLLSAIFSVFNAQNLGRSGHLGGQVRATLIAAIYRQSVNFSPESRAQIPNAQVVNHISTDISRIDFSANFINFTWGGIVQLIEALIILLVIIGYSTLPGFGLIIISIPLQIWALKVTLSFRRKSMVWTDKRIKGISEILQGIRVLKVFSWEIPFLDRISGFRSRELRSVSTILNLRSLTMSVAMCLPAIISVLIFVTYSLSGHGQNPAVIWSSFSLISTLRLPLFMLPNALSFSIDAFDACNRLTRVFLAPTRDKAHEIDPNAPFAIQVKNASFQWITPSAGPARSTKEQKPPATDQSGEKADATEERSASGLKDINLEIPRGQLCVIVGPVGSGKSSLLSALLGDMEQTSGEAKFGGSIAYGAQSAWIQNATIRDNITFGKPYDEKRYDKCVELACLKPDFAIFPDGDLTEIGEKGINMSGGQKQRVSICRVLYFDADIVLMDDPLSAVDARVAHLLMDNVILGELSGKTRVLVTHALHFVKHADYVICMKDGRISERGTYDDLVAKDQGNSSFAELIKQYGGQSSDQNEGDSLASETESTVGTDKKEADLHVEALKAEEDGQSIGNGGVFKTLSEVSSRLSKRSLKDPEIVKTPAKLMQEEERETGSINSSVFKFFFKACNGWTSIPSTLLLYGLSQGVQVLSQFSLTWWQHDSFGFNSDGAYMGIYSSLSVASLIFTFLGGVACTYLGMSASGSMHFSAFKSVLMSPVSFFDTTPIGRIINRFAKDCDNIDNRLNNSLRLCIITYMSIVGSAVTTGIVEPYFLLAYFGIGVVFVYLTSFYRNSARDIKRLENLTRSSMYAHFSESLNGISTVLAFGGRDRFIKRTEHLMDITNRAYLLTFFNQRWLGIRLDFMGILLTFIVSMVCVCKPSVFSPSYVGLALSSVMSIQSFLSSVVRQSVEVENDFSSVERLYHYSSRLSKEAEYRTTDVEQAPSDLKTMVLEDKWPQKGEIVFENVQMRYRPELPLVLKGVSFTAAAGEKIGVIGRTGAGKSSIMLSLFRIIEACDGAIKIDGVDISRLGLHDLRKKLSIIPQEAFLFSGTLRSNLDPFDEHDDLALNTSLQRASLPTGKFNLDYTIDAEGSNLSVGERSLVSLARAIVKDTKIVVLDEATASVDFETDSKIQQTIRTQFKNKTLLCIAHRINTIIGYDKILVMDQGKVVDFNDPVTLFLQPGIFRDLCDKSNISLHDIERSQDELKNA